MRMIRRTSFFSLLVAIVFAQNAGAIPVGGVIDANHSETFSIGPGLGSALIDCEVYKYTPGEFEYEYVYTYRISNIDSGIGLSFFSVGILDGASAEPPLYDHITGAVDPTNWSVVGSPVQSVDALFVNTINNGQSSALLWFASDYASTMGNGVLFGTSSGAPCYATGDLLTPMPEPATFVLLGTAGLWILTRKRRSALKTEN